MHETPLDHPDSKEFRTEELKIFFDINGEGKRPPAFTDKDKTTYPKKQASNTRPFRERLETIVKIIQLRSLSD